MLRDVQSSEALTISSARLAGRQGVPRAAGRVAKRMAVTLLALSLAGCKTIPQISRSLTASAAPTLDSTQSQLEQINSLAATDTEWFGNVVQSREALEARYTGDLAPTLAAYLESDIYVYDDPKLTAYLVGIIDRLLVAWQGPEPPLDVVVKSDTRFAAHVDALNQLHISTGLLRELESEDQLAAVLSHELAHALLRHSEEKASQQRMDDRLGSLRDTALALVSDERVVSKGVSAYGRDLNVINDSSGLLWTDLLVPAWSREREHEADRLGLDLLVAAGYNPGEFDAVLSKIRDADGARSRRLELIGSMANDGLAKEQERVSARVGESRGEMLGELAGSLLDARLDALARKTISHADSGVRSRTLRQYALGVHDDDRLPPASTYDTFQAALGLKDGGSALAGDLAAVETVIALADEDMRTARSAFERMADSDSPNVAARIATSSLDIAAKRYDEAIARLVKLVENPRAPVEAYLRLARLQAFRKDAPLALKTLKLGERRIGRSYRFLPTRIYIQKTAGMRDAAASSTVECAEYDAGIGRARMEKLAGFINTASDTYYRQCAEILGADPIAEQSEARRQQAQDLMDSTCGVLAKITGKETC